jgi:signal transduction histidine kinase
MASERQQETLAFLSTLSDRLAPVLTFEHLLDVVRQIPVPFLADWTMVHLVEPDGAVQCLLGVHVDMPRYAEPLAALSTLSSGPVLGTSHLAGAMATGLTTIVSSRQNPVAPLMTGLGHPVGVFDHLRMESVAMIPPVVDDKVKAVLSLVSRDADRFASATALVVDQVARALDLTLRRIRLFREAEDANRLKDEFLSTLSHELRTPLNAIFGWARILRRRQLDDGAAHAVEVIERNAELQIRLIEEVLDVSRIIAGKMTLAREPVDTAAILRTTIDTSRPAISAAISAKQIRLEEHISDSLPRIAEDPHRLQQVFSNLLSNALKFTPDRGSILVTLHKAGGVLRFDITDTGIGIRREVLPFVFDRFRQGDSSTTRHHGGLGLGLAIVRHIVEQHGGKIEAFSGGEGHGTTVTVVIPVDEGADASLRRRSSGAGGSDDVSKALRDATILVVEDHDDARELIAGCWRAPGRTCSWPRRPTRPLNARGRRSRTSCWPTWARRAKTASRCCGTFGPSILVFRPSR